MGSSTSAIVEEVMSMFWNIKPRTVLDVGVGTGKWGFLFREKVDFRNCHSEENFQVRIDGIEIDKQWIRDYHKLIYNDIYIDDLTKFRIKRDYDLIMMGDVIEHIEKEEGKAFLDRALIRCKYLIITAPLGDRESVFFEKQKKIYPHEEHKSAWSLDDFWNTSYNLLFEQVKLPNFVVLLKGAIPAHDEEESEVKNDG